MADTASSANALIFNSPDFALRVILRDGEPWFVAADIVAALGIGNVTDAMRRLDDDERGVDSIEGIHAGAGNPSINIINESGLYSLILGSRKPEAKKFKKWVTAEVLPGIRRTGQFGAAPEAAGGKLIAGLIAQSKQFGTALVEQNRRVALLSQRILAAEPTWAEIARYRSLGLTVAEIAKLQGISHKSVEKRITRIKASGIDLPERGSALATRRPPVLAAAQSQLDLGAHHG